MRPLNGTRSILAGSSERLSFAIVIVRVQRLACARLSFALGALQLWPWRSPEAVLVSVIWSFAVADSVKRKLVPSGCFLAEIAGACFVTRKRLWVRLTAVSVGGGVAAFTAAGAIVNGITALAAMIPYASLTVSVTFALPAVVGVPVICPLVVLIESPAGSPAALQL